MARVTVEDCIDKVENRFELVLLASHRARMVSSGAPITIDRDNDKNPVVALREIADFGDLPGRPQGRPDPRPAEICRGRRARARDGAAHLRWRWRRGRRYRGHRRPHDRGRAAQGPRGPCASRGASGAAGAGRGRLSGNFLEVLQRSAARQRPGRSFFGGFSRFCADCCRAPRRRKRLLHAAFAMIS